jgi:hypothetical protein
MKKIVFILIFMLVAGPVFARDASNTKRIIRLQEDRRSLSAAYERKQQELSEITLKIHEIDSRLDALKGKPD